MRARHFAAILILMAAMLTTTACRQGTFVVLSISSTRPIEGINQLDLELDLGGQRAIPYLAEDDGSPIQLPTSAALEIASGEGPLTVTVVARSAPPFDEELARGSSSTNVIRGATFHLAVEIGSAGSGDAGGGSVDAVPDRGFDATSDRSFDAALDGAD